MRSSPTGAAVVLTRNSHAIPAGFGAGLITFACHETTARGRTAMKCVPALAAARPARQAEARAGQAARPDLHDHDRQPGAGRFTVFRDGVLFVNDGPAIARATGFMVCTPRPVR